MIYGLQSQLSARCQRKSPEMRRVFIGIICDVDWCVLTYCDRLCINTLGQSNNSTTPAFSSHWLLTWPGRQLGQLSVRAQSSLLPGARQPGPSEHCEVRTTQPSTTSTSTSLPPLTLPLTTLRLVASGHDVTDSGRQGKEIFGQYPVVVSISPPGLLPKSCWSVMNKKYRNN